MGWACKTHGWDEKYVQNFGWEACMEDTSWKNSMERLAQDTDLWLIHVNTVMNFLVPYKVDNFMTT
jgi:hypothetical protein